MKTATFRKQLETSFPITLALQRIDKTIFIHKISVNSNVRQKGIGSAVMQLIIQWCDDNQFICTLSPTDNFGCEINRLINFYTRFGFTFVNDEMIRNPKRLK